MIVQSTAPARPRPYAEVAALPASEPMTCAEHAIWLDVNLSRVGDALHRMSGAQLAQFTRDIDSTATVAA
jgi:hypothetical protein